MNSRVPQYKRCTVVSAVFLSLILVSICVAQEYTVATRGQNHRVWKKVTEIPLPNGGVGYRTNSYTEVGTAMHYFKEGQWLESKSQFQLFPGGAVAQEGAMQLILSPDISSDGSVDLLTAEGKRLVSSPRWLAYYDPATGHSEIIAAVKSCVGQLIEPGVVVYADAFDDLKAAIRYTYKPWAIEQDVVLLESGPLDPQQFGFNANANVRLEMWSELLTYPEPDRIVNSVQDGLNDSTIVFGDTQIGLGKAFSLDGEDAPVAVAKSWLSIEQRRFLVESVRQADIVPHLGRLPQQARANNPVKQVKGLAQRRPAVSRSDLLAKGKERLRARERKTETASIQRTGTRLAQGLVIDYTTVATAANVTFRGDTTYYVNGGYTLSGVTTIEGGTVLKFSTNTSSLLITGSIDCKTSRLRPAIFTAKDDDFVGEAISGSTGITTNYYATKALDLNAASTAYDLHDLRFRYQAKAIRVSASTATLTLSHSQIGNASNAIDNPYPGGVLRNVLIHDSRYAVISASGGTNRFEHATIHRVGTLRDAGTIFLTNSLLISVTNGMTYSGISIAANQVEAGIFQVMGGGQRYLAAGSTNRNAGTTNINTTLLRDIRQCSSYPPLELTNPITLNVTLSPQVQRDTDVPDLGYLYPAMDYMLRLTPVRSNAVVTVSPGTVLGWSYIGAFWLQDTDTLICEGTPSQRNQFVRFNAVQEFTTNYNGAASGSLTIYSYPLSGSPASVQMRFTDFNNLAGHGDSFSSDGANFVMTSLLVRDCTFHATPLTLYGTSSHTYTLFNNIFEGGSLLVFAQNPVLTAHHNLFIGGAQYYLERTGSSWILRDNAFVNTTVVDEGGGITHDHNAYINTTGLLSATNGTDKVLGSLAFETGTLGRYYQPTSSALIGAGSRNATNAGLYHFTTTTNNVKETNSVVDIGPHYAATDSTGIPLDSDSDGTSDYKEDANSNGSYDATNGETDWQTYNSLFGVGSGPGLVVFTPLK